MKPIETEYGGYKFRSRLEARWAIFLDAINAEWTYEEEGFDLGNGLYYLPDFKVKCYWSDEVVSDKCFDLYLEIKGEMTDEDLAKIEKFAEEKSILIVGEIPYDVEETIIQSDENYKSYLFKQYFICGNWYATVPCIDKTGKLTLACDHNYLNIADVEITRMSYKLARQARFEHGETPSRKEVRKAVMDI